MKRCFATGLRVKNIFYFECAHCSKQNIVTDKELDTMNSFGNVYAFCKSCGEENQVLK